MRRSNHPQGTPVPDQPALSRRVPDNSNPGRCLRPLAALLLQLARERLVRRLAGREIAEKKDTQSARKAASRKEAGELHRGKGNGRGE
jgi:hypothetical protein